jgi:phage tail-like protein
VSDPSAGAAPGTWVDPYRAYNFKLLIQGVTEGHFTACTGLGISVDAIAYRQGGDGPVVHRIPGQVDFGEVTLSYGLTTSRQLWDWFLTATTGSVVRKNVSIVMLDADGAAPVMQWNLINAWACRWRGAPLDGLSHEVAIESLTLVFESLERD